MNMHISPYWPLCFFVFSLLLGAGACKHDPFLEDDTFTPVDTTDVNPGDTTNMGTPCDPDVVYFDQQVLPILRSNCALSGCHDAATAQEEVILTSYENVMQTAEIVPFDLNESKLYEVITDDDPEDRMPPSPNTPLNSEQVQLIAKWILQGAKDL